MNKSLTAFHNMLCQPYVHCIYDRNKFQGMLKSYIKKKGK